MSVVVLDTNIFISAFRFRGRPLDLVLMGVDREIDIVLSESIIEETLRVLRDKFTATQAEMETALQIMHACGRKVEPAVKLDVVTDDPNDNHIVECAVTAGADAIITGDQDLLRMSKYQGIAMLRVGEFLGRGC